MCIPSEDYPCFECEGEGKKDGKECRLCGGTGSIDLDNFNPMDEEPEELEEDN